MMDLDELQSVQSRERQTDSLQQLRESFYRDAGEYISQLRRERDRAAEQADDPWNAPEVSRLTDDIDTAEGTVEAIYERRVGKIVKMASLAAADMPTDDEGLTAEERDLFETLVDSIEHNRLQVEAILDGDDPAAVHADREEDPTDPGGDPDATARAPPSDTNALSRESAADPDPAEPRESANAGDKPGRIEDPPADAPPGTDTGGEESTEPAPPADESGQVDAADLMGGGGSAPADDDMTPPAEAGRTGPGSGETREERAPGGATDEVPAGATADEVPAGPAADEVPDGEEAEDSAPAVERETVRITNDVGEIFGVDERRYDLTADDVVTLPSDNADPLVERDAAERLD